MSFFTLDGCREQIVRELPGLMNSALQSYKNLIELIQPTESRERKRHEEACKASVSHLTLLYKLYLLITGKENTNVPEENLQELIQKAQEELNQNHQIESEHE